jgi:hypothetical protein
MLAAASEPACDGCFVPDISAGRRYIKPVPGSVPGFWRWMRGDDRNDTIERRVE